MKAPDILKFLRKNPIATGSGVLILALAAGIVFRSDALPAAEALLEQKTREGTRLAANISNAEHLGEHLERLSASRTTAEARLIPPDQLAKNLQYFYMLEAETGVKLIELRQEQASGAEAAPAKKPKTSYVGVPFAVAVEGPYPQVLKFLRRIESGTHYARVLSYTLGSAAGAGGETGAGGGALVTLTMKLELLGSP